VNEELVRSAGHLISECGFAVLIVPGNHDAAGLGSIYEIPNLREGAPNLAIVSNPRGEWLHLRDPEVSVWAVPIADHSPRNRPLAVTPPRPPRGWCALVAHGHYSDQAEPVFQSSPISFHELASVEADYVALGHWDLPTTIRNAEPPISWYSGAPVRDGEAGGALLVTLDPTNGVIVEVEPLSPFVPDKCVAYSTNRAR